MQFRPADPEDQREVHRCVNVIHSSIVQNGLHVMYFMEALQALYANYARRVVSFEEYCKALDEHKKDYEEIWKE